MASQLELPGTPDHARLIDERDVDALDREEDVSTCRTDGARCESMRLTLLGMAGRSAPSLGLAGRLLRDYGELARVVLRRRPWGEWTGVERLADAYLARAGVPEDSQVELEGCDP